jgi:hypothetical protein
MICPDCNQLLSAGGHRHLCPAVPKTNINLVPSRGHDALLKPPGSELVAYFAGDGFSHFGHDGDERGQSPEQCAVYWLREFSALMRTKAGMAAYSAMLHQRLVDKGLVPA